jgi:outer membrane protein OmpA-like peptidoglycan-associated protein
MKSLKLTTVLLFLTTLAMGQMEFSGPKKAPQIGFSGNLVDFSASLPKIGKVDPGYSIMFWNGLTNHLDYSFRYNGLFSNYQKVGTATNEATDYKNELELAFHLKALSDDHLFNPFLTAGVGVGNYAKKAFTPYAPLGVGLQINLASDSYIYLQGNYRMPFQEKKLDKNTFFSLGVAQSLGARKEKVVETFTPPVVVADVKDSDNDGIPDNQDACPNQAGTKALNGCPDRDGDGIADKDDACPDQAGTKALNGCPDRDGDGIADKDDACPDQAGTKALKGCPDRDGDGVADKDDACPDVPGLASNKGCPEVKAEVKSCLDEAAKNIYFEFNSDKLTGAATESALNSILGCLKNENNLKIDILGYTDKVGTDEYNQKLSEKRSAAVKNWLVKKGINASRLKAIGYGESQAVVAETDTEDARQADRKTVINPHYD